MGMSAMLLMWPRPSEQFLFFQPRRIHLNLVPNSRVALEKIFEIVERVTEVKGKDCPDLRI